MITAAPHDAVAHLANVRQRIDAAAKSAGRSADEIVLIAVSKTHGEAAIEPLLQAGHRIFGENRVQEAKAKWPALRDRHRGIELHLIGPLQSNKARDAVELFDAIHTIDRPKIAEAIAAEMSRQGKAPQLFVQVNTGEEPQKAGVGPRDLAGILEICRDRLGLAIAGLMCIPPVEEEPAVHFAFLAKLAREHGLKSLSMGMSEDFETAIGFGATHARIGSAVFGARGGSL